jgi:23S rRNA pseudouridine2605 synthase
MDRVKQRIQKILANAGVASRRNVEEMIRQGRVAVNGKVMIELPILVDPFKDKITVDDELVKIDRRLTQDRVYFLMYKPRGIYSTNVSQGEQKRAIDLLPPDVKERVYPVGRLDADSKGLLLLTNDGELTNQLTHPRYGISKTYRAVVDGYIEPEQLQELEHGVWMGDPRTGKGFKTGRARIRIVHRSRQQSILELTIREGRNRQVRRMLARLGHKVRDLTRIKMGPLTLDGLKPGDVRTLTLKEIKQLRKLGRDEPRSHGDTEARSTDHADRPSKPSKKKH